MDKAIFLGILGKHTDKIEIYDTRFEKPRISIENGDQEALFQFIDEFDISNKSMHVLRFNQVSINMSIAKKHCEQAEKLYRDLIEKQSEYNKQTTYDRAFLVEFSKKMCDYVESVQIAIIAAYTSVEAFVNLSIPENYVYRKQKSNGYYEEYNSYGIQKNMRLRDKIKEIIAKLYDVEKLFSEVFWSDLCNLEEIRNELIHLKRDKYPDIVQKLLNPTIFKYIKSSNEFVEYVLLKDETRPENSQTVGNEYRWPMITSENLTLYSANSLLSLNKEHRRND